MNYHYEITKNDFRGIYFYLIIYYFYAFIKSNTDFTAFITILAVIDHIIAIKIIGCPNISRVIISPIVLIIKQIIPITSSIKFFPPFLFVLHQGL